MNRNRPPDATAGILAPHIPADIYRRAEVTGQPIVIVQSTPAPRANRHDHLYVLAVGLAGAAGVMGLVAAALALLEFAVRAAALVAGAAGPIGVGGIALRLARPHTK